MTDSEWFRKALDEIFGAGGQSSFARFLRLCGDTREHATLLRTISNAANGVRKITPEMRALLTVLRLNKAKIEDLIHRAIWWTD